MSVISVNDENFEAEVLQSDKPVLVDFWAEWCGPCKAMLPVVEQVAGENADVKVVKVNIEESPETPTQYGVRGIPTFALFKNGEVADVKVGGMTKDDMVSWLQSA